MKTHPKICAVLLSCAALPSAVANAFLQKISGVIAGAPAVDTFHFAGCPEDDERLLDAAAEPDLLYITGAASTTDDGIATFRDALPPLVAGTRDEPGNRGYE